MFRRQQFIRTVPALLTKICRSWNDRPAAGQLIFTLEINEFCTGQFCKNFVIILVGLQNNV